MPLISDHVLWRTEELVVRGCHTFNHISISDRTVIVTGHRTMALFPMQRILLQSGTSILIHRQQLVNGATRRHKIVHTTRRCRFGIKSSTPKNRGGGTFTFICDTYEIKCYLVVSVVEVKDYSGRWRWWWDLWTKLHLLLELDSRVAMDKNETVINRAIKRIISRWRFHSQFHLLLSMMVIVLCPILIATTNVSFWPQPSRSSRRRWRWGNSALRRLRT